MDPATAALSIRAMADLATPMSIRVAATLGLVDRAGSAGATPEQLASETATAPPALRRLLDHLVTVGVFDLDTESGRYRPTSLGAQLSEDSPEGIKPLLDINRAGGRAELAFVELLGTITTGAPAYAHRYGREILDVGGGDGTVLAAILRAHPDLRGRVLQLAPTAAAATARFAAAGLDDRAGAVSGSFFDPLPAGADAYLLSDILHDWDDDHAREILAGCRRAAAPDGTLVVIEPVRGRGVFRGSGTDGRRAGRPGRRERTRAPRFGSGGGRADGTGVRSRGPGRGRSRLTNGNCRGSGLAFWS